MEISDQELARVIGQRDSNHPTAEDLAALADQSLPTEQREALLAHLERCANCARAVAVAMESQSDPGFRSGPRWLAVAASGVAAVALAWVLWFGGSPPEDTLRAANGTLLPPTGAVVESTTGLFSWPMPADRSLRRVRLMNQSAETLWISDLTIPPLDLPQRFGGDKTTFLWQLEDADGVVVAGPQWFRIP